MTNRRHEANDTPHRAQASHEPRSRREDLLRLLSDQVAPDLADAANTVPGSSQHAFGCYYLDSAGTATNTLTDTGVHPDLPSRSEQRASEVRVDETLAEQNLMQTFHAVLDAEQPSLEGVDSARSATVRWWPTVETAKREIKRVHPDRARYSIVGVTPRRLLDQPVLVADFAAAVSTLSALQTALLQYDVDDTTGQFLESAYAEPVREQAQEYWATATVCRRRETLESAIFCDNLEWPELRYSGVVPPENFDATIDIAPD